MPRRIPNLTKKRRINTVNHESKIIVEPSETPLGDAITITIDGVGVIARPYYIVDGTPQKYATSCPKCGHGIFVSALDIKLDILPSCQQCGAGQSQTTAIFIDPFINPLSTNLITEIDLSEELTPVDIENDANNINKDLNILFNDTIISPKPQKTKKPKKTPQNKMNSNIVDPILTDINPELIDILNDLSDA